jgi:hypothetical protein
MIGVSVADTTLGTLVANLGYDKLVFPKPVFAGDTLRSESECIALREASRGPTPASSPGRTAASTSAASWCANAPHRAAAEEAAMTSRAAGCSSRRTARRRSPRRSRARPTRSSSTSRTASPGAEGAARDILKGCPRAPAGRNGGCGSTRSAASITRTTSSCSASPTFHGIVLPKAESGADVAQLAHRTGNIPIHAIVTETAGEPVRPALYRDPGRRWRR